MVNRHRAIEMLGQDGLVRAAKVGSPCEGQALVSQDLGGFVVRDAGQRRLHSLEGARVAANRGQLALPPVQHSSDD